MAEKIDLVVFEKKDFHKFVYNLGDTQKFYKRQNVAQGSQKYHLRNYFKMAGISKMAFGDFLNENRCFSLQTIFC
jgi:hypothetical protein